MNIHEITTKIQVYTIDECNEEKKKLIEAAKKITKDSYAPYSKFHVGAAVLLEDGQIITGANQENAAYPVTLCAERTALFYANTQNPNTAVKAIAIAAFTDGDFTNEICAPCGSCRQAISEIEARFDHSISVIMYGKKHIYEVTSIQDLLPLSFGKESLPED